MNENNIIEQKTDIKADVPAGVDESPTAWIWANRIPRGQVTLLTGMPKTGKHLLCCWLSAVVSAGLDWPDEGMTPISDKGVTQGMTPPGNLLPEYKTAAVGTVVLITDPESHVRINGPYTSKIITDRVARQGGNVDNVLILDTKRFGEDAFDILKNADELNKSLGEIPDCRLLILDPMDAFVDADLKDEAIAGQVYQVLAKIAKDRNIAVVCTDKYSPRRRCEINALSEHARGRPPEIHGSQAFVDLGTNVLESYIDKTDTRFFGSKAKILTMVRSNCCDSPRDIRHETSLGKLIFNKEKPAPQATGKGTSLMTGRTAKTVPGAIEQAPSEAVKPQTKPESNITPEKSELIKLSVDLVTEPEPDPDPQGQAAQQRKAIAEGEGF